MAAAEEEYAKRAYPAAYVPFELTRNAHAAWSNARARALAIGTPALGQWTLVGPSSANDPNVLTFSGAPYTTSGRVTALALAPNCEQAQCTFTSQQLEEVFGKRTAPSIPALRKAGISSRAVSLPTQ